MGNYKTSGGQCIADVAINANGDVSFVNQIIELNDYDTWTPSLTGEILVPDTKNNGVLLELFKYPSSVNLPDDITMLLATIENILNNIVVTSFEPYEPVTVTTTEKYIVNDGECLADIVLNTTGDVANIDSFCNENNIESWNEKLTQGIEYLVPKVDKNRNVLTVLINYPASNNIDYTNLNDKILNLISNFSPPSKLFEDGAEFIFEDEIEYKYENE
jgi:hypothetical protein